MQTILRILERAGGYRPTLYLKIENPPYMALVIEAMPEPGPLGLPALSVAHYGEQNGDLMRDPEMCFEWSKPPLCGLSSSLLLAQRLRWASSSVRAIRTGRITSSCPTSTDEHEQFAALWDRNLRDRAFSKPSRTSRFAASPLSLWSGYRPECHPLRVFHPATARKEHIIMETQVINATEYRNVPLVAAERVEDQPAPHLRGCRLEGTGREHPQPGRSLALAGAATHRERLRDRLRSAALPRRADGRSRTPCPSASAR